MFKFAALTSVVAATTAKATAKKTIASVKENVITGISDISLAGISMPKTLVIPTWAELQLPALNADNAQHAYCLQAGGAWTAVKGSTTDSTCDFTSKAGAAILAANKKDELKEVTLDPKLSFEDFFKSLNVAGIYGAEDCSNSYNVVSWAAESPANVEKINKKAEKLSSKVVTKAYSWAISWNAANNFVDTPCFMKTTFPLKWKGGLVLTHVKNDFVNMAVHVESKTLPRYFTQHTLTTNALGKTGKIPIATAEAVEVFMQSGATAPTTAMTAATTSSVTFERMSTIDLGKLTLEHGGAVVWIIIGILVCLGCLAGVVLWKLGKCCVREIEGEKADNEFYQEDCYVRV